MVVGEGDGFDERALRGLLGPFLSVVKRGQAIATAEAHFAAIGWSGLGTLRVRRTWLCWRASRRLDGWYAPSAEVEIDARTGAVLAMDFDQPPVGDARADA